MAAMDLHPVEPGALRPVGGGGELIDDEADILHRHHLQLDALDAPERRAHDLLDQEGGGEVPAPRLGHRRRPDRPPGEQVLHRRRAAVVELRHDPRAMRMDRIDQRREAGQETIVRDRDLPLLVGADRPCHSRHAGDDEADAAARLLGVIGDDALAALAVVLGEARAHRGDGDAVAQLHPPDPAGGKQMRESRGGHRISCPLNPPAPSRAARPAPGASR